VSDKTIWKFDIEPCIACEISLPRDARILCVQVQHGRPRVWALVNPHAEQEVRTFRVFGTGHPVPKPDKGELFYIGTFQIRDGALVFHLFEEVTAS